ncbi:hypothetical protein PMI19_02283 [Pseudomonas sp. GM16]|nr:hypothetical protein PMI19_02283 [Pseudomonas sp. GM16]
MPAIRPEQPPPICAGTKISNTPQNLWELACQRLDQSSHPNMRWNQNLQRTTKPVGAGLPAIRPEQPPPICAGTKISNTPQNLWELACQRLGQSSHPQYALEPKYPTHHKTCGSWLASDGARPATPNMRWNQNLQHTTKPVGAGLPAMRPVLPSQNLQTQKKPCPAYTEQGFSAHQSTT